MRLRQGTQLSDTDIAKALLILLQDGYTGAGNDGVSRCLTTSLIPVEPENRYCLHRTELGRQDNDNDNETS